MFEEDAQHLLQENMGSIIATRVMPMASSRGKLAKRESVKSGAYIAGPYATILAQLAVHCW